MQKLSKIFFIFIIAGILIFATVDFKPLRYNFTAYFYSYQVKSESGLNSEDYVDYDKKYISSRFFEAKDLIIKELEKNNNKNSSYFTQIGITSHHLPTAVSFIADFYKSLLNSKGPRNTFIVLGPDHFERCKTSVSTTKKSYTTPFGNLRADDEIINELLDNGVYVDDQCFEGEHSIGVQAIFIKYLFPEAEIVPVTFSASTRQNAIENIADVLVKHRDKITVIGSVDFSHYQNYIQANQSDDISENMLKKFDGNGFNLSYVDSPSVVKLAILLSQKFNLEDVAILGRANSFDFTGRFENTTGYINAIFTDRKKQAIL